MNIHIRPATIEDCDALGLITVSASLKTFLGQIPEEDFDFSWTPAVSAANWRNYFGDMWEAGEFFVVAEVEHRVVGYVWAGKTTGRTDYTHFVNGLYVLPAFHGEGIGRVLLRYVANRLCNEGVNSLLIGCLKENPSCGFYQHLGGAEVYREPNRMDRYATEEIFFGWCDLTELL